MFNQFLAMLHTQNFDFCASCIQILRNASKRQPFLKTLYLTIEASYHFFKTSRMKVKDQNTHD